MKKGLGLLVVMSLVLLFAACSGKSDSGSSGSEVKTEAASSETENTYHTNLNDSNSSKLSFGGLSLRIPPEFGGPASNSKENTQYFYLPMTEQNKLVSLLVEQEDANLTKEQFEKQRGDFTSSFLQAIDNSELKERKGVIIAGLQGERILAEGTTQGLPCVFDVAFAFSESNKKVYIVGIGTVQKDIQEYRSTLDNILGSATVSSNTAFEFVSADLSAGKEAETTAANESETEKSDAAALEQNLNDLLGDSEAEGSANDAAGNASGISPEFKAALDSYEQFFDEYISIMNRMKNNPTDLSLLSQYTDYMGRYADMLAKFEALEKTDMTKEEMAYYLEVSNRINQKLLNAL